MGAEKNGKGEAGASRRAEHEALRSLAAAFGVSTSFTDGLGQEVDSPAETLVAVCRALGSEIERPGDAVAALAAFRERRGERLEPVYVAWDGAMPSVPWPEEGAARAEVGLEEGGALELTRVGAIFEATRPLPPGYHRLTVETGGRVERATIVSAPTLAWRPLADRRGWGVGTHLAALRTGRSRSLGDLADLRAACAWVGSQGGDFVSVLPLLPTFNRPPAEPSPYSPVSRLFWSELILDLGEAHRPVLPPSRLDPTRADEEVRAALAGRPLPDASPLDPELRRYAAFRGAQVRLGRNWRAWPADARDGSLTRDQVDPDEERFHLLAQEELREQLGVLRRELEAGSVRLGLDLAVGVHPDGYDPWSRRHLFADGISVGAPPDRGFPSGQDWGFPPVLPQASRREGHRYLAASIAHQAALAGVLRIDHVMAMTRLYWIPHGARLDEGAYVSYPSEELFAVLTLESHRNRCEIVGENLGVVPEEIEEALPRHGIRGMYLVEFEAGSEEPRAPDARQVASIGTHDTPTLAGWIEGVDIDERVRCGLLDEERAPEERERRAEQVARLADALEVDAGDRAELLAALLEWLGASESPLVAPWIEDLWLEPGLVNVPGTSSSMRPNWQRPMGRALDEAASDPEVLARVRALDRARSGRVARP